MYLHHLILPCLLGILHSLTVCMCVLIHGLIRNENIYSQIYTHTYIYTCGTATYVYRYMWYTNIYTHKHIHSDMHILIHTYRVRYKYKYTYIRSIHRYTYIPSIRPYKRRDKYTHTYIAIYTGCFSFGQLYVFTFTI